MPIVELSLQHPLMTEDPAFSPAATWDHDAGKRALDDLFSHTTQFRESQAYGDLLAFIRRFRFYAPFNAMLVHVQMPGATYVAPAHRWIQDFGRRISAGARPLVILQPMGPVMFVFDVSETDATEKARPLPPEVDRPFEIHPNQAKVDIDLLIENAKRDGIRVRMVPQGSQSAGLVQCVARDIVAFQLFQTGIDKSGKPIHASVPVRYDVVINDSLGREAKYVTLAHELAHLYCGHQGSPHREWWPDRRGLDQSVREFEAESVAYLVCGRAGLDTLSSSADYLKGYFERHNEVPPISLDCVLKTSGLIESMSRRRLPERKVPKTQRPTT